MTARDYVWNDVVAPVTDGDLKRMEDLCRDLTFYVCRVQFFSSAGASAACTVSTRPSHTQVTCELSKPKLR